MDLGDLIGAAGTVAGGGLFGLIGSAVGQVSKHFQRKQEMAWEKEKWSHEFKLQELQMQARAEETEQELAIAQQVGSWQGLQTSLETVFQPESGWAKDVKAMFRPFLTTLLWVLAAWVFYRVYNGAMEQWLSATETKDIVKYMVYTVFFTASSATMWWFGDRALTPPKWK